MTDDLAGLVRHVHDGIDPDEAMRRVARLVEWDRHQGSAGIAAAADFVAGEAERVGLADVEVLSLPADGRTAWWTFTAPSPWTARAAHLSVGAGPRLVDYAAQPYALAVNSTATDAELSLAHLQDDAWPPGAVVLVPSAGDLDGRLLARLRDRRAGGFCVTARPDLPDHSGRLELPADSGLFAFSVLPAQLDELHRTYRLGGRVRVVVDVDTTPARMPVVVARTPTRPATGRGASSARDACLIAAHLCHPAPSANDNASGVAAALAAGRALAELPLRRPVRFVWGPEFVGLAAYVHRSAEEGRPLPTMAVNLDMAGEDQRRCGGPLIVERSPEYLPHFANAVVEACVRALPPAARSYSGAVDCDVWAWRATPFVGASDHAILADRAIGCPAVQLGHWPDRFNHSGADTLDKVDPQELRRSAAIAASAAAVVATAGPRDADRIARHLTRWTAHRMTACLPPSTDPLATERLTRHWQFGRDALPTLRQLGAGEDVLDRQTRLLADLHRTLTAACDRPPVPPPRGGPVLRRTWPGPFNLRALMGAVDEADRAWLQRRLTVDRGGFYATAMALAQSIDGVSDTARVIRTAQLDSGLEWERDVGERFLTALAGAGWVEETEQKGMG
ncbi:DUF4910 domain-containing protein [Streptomyces sp. NBC_01304]|uniref:DUF4910 domain-containing protein n=1 Tax=Streptomyces sp. NBC_01304 TaxID=2903818 RepID=UPI002E11D222|nr:DUF4910 domain-containing protein [Streptomyces sp. NBC_01304]